MIKVMVESPGLAEKLFEPIKPLIDESLILDFDVFIELDPLLIQAFKSSLTASHLLKNELASRCATHFLSFSTAY